MSSVDDPIAPRAIVAGHGGFAEGIVSAVQVISGRGGVFIPLSNTGLDAMGLEALVRDAVQAHGVRVVFTDLPAGSCTMAARRVARVHPDLTVVTGANLAMLLDFAFESGDPAVASEHAAAKAHAAITVVPPAGTEAGGAH